MTATVTVVAPGSSEHGVVRYARRMATASDACFIDLPSHTAAEGWAALLAGHRAAVVHAHYTDQLFGARCEDGPTRLARLRAGGQRLVVTLHDVPTGDGSDRDRRRVAAYGEVVAMADAVIVSSGHEGDRLRACGITTPAEVIPLSWEPLPSPRPVPLPSPRPPPGRPVVGVLGFVFPGKGHRDAIDAARCVGRDVEVWALGAVSASHRDLGVELARHADHCGVPFRITGFLDDHDLADLVAQVAVPVAPHSEVSASASVNTWIGARRRPLVRANDYSRELAVGAPRAVSLYGPDGGGLAGAIRIALAHPAATWIAERPAHLSPAAIGARHAAVYHRLGATT